MDYVELRKEIEKADCITIFRHVNPDCDAVGSQFGLKNWILDNYPNKSVYACGNEEPNQGEWPSADHPSDEVISSSLAIVLDTANRERADDSRFLSAKRILKVDHHPAVDQYGHENLVEEEAAATCEILTRFISSFDSVISCKTASYLYAGLLTDTLNYTTTNTTSATLQAGSLLAGYGVDIPSLSRTLFDRSLSEFRFASYLRSHVSVIDEKVATVMVDEQILEEYGLTGGAARGFIDELGHVKEFEVWTIFTEKHNGERKLYDGSLRSKHIAVNDIAAQFNGGGHRNAAGIKNLTREDVDALLAILTERVKDLG